MLAEILSRMKPVTSEVVSQGDTQIPLIHPTQNRDAIFQDTERTCPTYTCLRVFLG